MQRITSMAFFYEDCVVDVLAVVALVRTVAGRLRPQYRRWRATAHLGTKLRQSCADAPTKARQDDWRAVEITVMI
jgi:hypothetical protein